MAALRFRYWSLLKFHQNSQPVRSAPLVPPEVGPAGRPPGAPVEAPGPAGVGVVGPEGLPVLGPEGEGVEGPEPPPPPPPPPAGTVSPGPRYVPPWPKLVSWSPRQPARRRAPNCTDLFMGIEGVEVRGPVVWNAGSAAAQA